MFSLHRTLISSAFVALLAIAGTPAEAQNSSGIPVATAPADANGDARAPYAWTDFCKRMPSECRVDTREPERIELPTRLITRGSGE